MYEAQSAEYIRIYESVVIEFLLRLKIHAIKQFDIEIWYRKPQFHCEYG